MLKLLIVAKTIPIQKLNYDIMLFHNHDEFIALTICYICLICAIILASCLGIYEIDRNSNELNKHAMPVAMVAISASMVLIIGTLWTQGLAFKITQQGHFEQGAQITDTQIQLSMSHINHEKANISIYKKDINNSIAKHRLLTNQHKMNKNIKYDNQHIKQIRGPWIRYKFGIPYGHQISSWWHKVTTKQYHPGQ